MSHALYAVFATDAPGRAAVRAATRETHRLYLRQTHPDGLVVVLGGPTLDDADAMNGTLLVVRAGSREAVERFVADDPYSRAALFESVTIRAWRCGLALPELLALPAAS